MPTKPRRRPGEARAEITRVAQELFARHGYQGTTLRLVATTAGVNEALIFRHFHTKEQLFRETIVHPFQEFVDDLLARWQQRETPLTNEALVALFVGELYDFAREHQDVLFALVNAERFADAETAGIAGSLSAQVQRIGAASTAEAEARGIAHADFALVVPGVMATVLGVVLLDPWLFPAGAGHPDEQALRAWMIDHAYNAIRPPGDPA